MKKSKSSGFTLVEILVVVSIIGILITLAILSFSSTEEISRNNTRLSDIKQIQLSLEEYYKYENAYPSELVFGDKLTGSSTGKTFLNIVPKNPEPRDDGDCVDQEYQYTYNSSTKSYTLDFCLSMSTSEFEVGDYSAIPSGIAAKNNSNELPSELGDYRVKITVLSSKVATNLNNFPIYVNLADLPTEFHSNVKTDGSDIRVTTSDGATEVPREIVSYANGIGELHFKGNISSSADTDFYIYYANSDLYDYEDNAIYGAENVWDNNYKAVFHLKEDPSSSAPQFKDSTSNSNNAISSGSMTSGNLVSAKLNKGINFDGIDDALTTVSNIGISGSESRTVSAWVKQPTANNKNVLGFGSQSVGKCFDLVLNAGKAQLHCYGSGYNNLNTSPVYATNIQFYYVGTYDGTYIRTYVNAAGGGAAWTMLNTTISTLKIGAATYTPLNVMNGIIDEVRVSNNVRSEGWVTTEYNNQNNTSAFFEIGEQEKTTAL